MRLARPLDPTPRRARAHRRVVQISAAVLALALAPAAAVAYPGGTPDYQTDVAPFCAGCHASRSEGALAGAPPERAAKETAANKHLALVRTGAKVQGGPGYDGLSEADRALLAKQIEALDAASTVKLEVPARVKAGETFTVKVTVTGGSGPVVGVGLTDTDQRWWARPAASAGWEVTAPPQIAGADGKPQTEWLAKRPEQAGRNVSWVNAATASDAAAGKWGGATVTWTLRAPATPGRRPLAAVYLYGTEKATPLGYVVDPKDPLQRKSIRGGFTGGSGRVLFSNVAQVDVQ